MNVKFLVLISSLLPLGNLAIGQTTTTSETTIKSVKEAPMTEKMPETERSVVTSSAVGIMVKDGNAYLIRGGQMTAIDSEISMTVYPDGKIKGFEGQSIILPEGQMLTMDGRFSAAPSNLVVASKQLKTTTVDNTPQVASTPVIRGSSDPGMKEKNINGRDGAFDAGNGMNDTVRGSTSSGSGGSSNSSGSGSGTK